MYESNQKYDLNVPKIPISVAEDILTDMLVNAIKNGFGVQKLQSTMLWGAPGVGKSQGVKEIANRVSIKTGKNVKVNDIRLLMFNPIDLRGIPVANKNKTDAIWLKPEIFNLDESEDVLNILFLDEITAAPQTVQACAYQITLDHKLGEHKLPENTYVICAGNRKSDNSVSNQMPKALCNRMMHFDIESDFEEWKKWALKNNINDQIIGFLQFKPEFLCKGLENKSDVAFASPRTWEMVSNVLNYMGNDNLYLQTMISGIIGVGIASEFITFCKYVNSLPNIDDIFEGKIVEIPKNPDILYSLISAMTTKAREYIMNKKSIDNAIEYAMKFPADFSYVFHSNIVELMKIYSMEMIIDDKMEEWSEMLEEKIEV